MIIPNIWENKKCSKPPTRMENPIKMHDLGVPHSLGNLHICLLRPTWRDPTNWAISERTDSEGVDLETPSFLREASEEVDPNMTVGWMVDIMNNYGIFIITQERFNY